MKIIANMLFAVVLFLASIWLWFKAVDFMGFQSFDLLWASLTGNGNFIPWEIDFQYLKDWVGYYWNAWIWGGIIIGFVVSISFVVLVYKLTRFTKKEKENLRSDKAFKSLLEKGVKKSDGIYSGKYGRRDFFVSYQDRGLVVGPPGTGKTAFLINQILKAADNKLSFIASDIKPEIQSIIEEELERKGFNIVTINPLSDEGHHYNPLDDVASEAEINEMVMNILPLPPRTEPAWVKAQRKYLRLALLYLHTMDGLKCSLPAAYAMFVEFDDAKSFLAQISTSENQLVAASAKKLKSELSSSKPAQAGFSEVFDELNWLHYKSIFATLSDSDFSINDLGQNPPIALFIQFEETQLKTLGALLSLLYGHILNVLIRNSNRQPVALFFDEIGNLPIIEG